MTTKELLGLLPVFDAIFVEGNLSRAAERLGVSQSAVSQSLARLRHITSDELFQSTGRGMRPTPRALLMVRHVRASLAEAAMAAMPRDVDLAKLERTFTIDIGAGFDALLVPGLYSQVTRQAPLVKLDIVNTRAGDPANALRAGEIELALDFAPSTAPGIRSKSVLPSPMVVITRQAHPELASALTEAQYFSLKHVTVNWARSIAPNGIALELMRMGREVRSALSVPTLFALGAVVASTDLVATVSRAAANQLAQRFSIAVHDLPFSMPPAQLYQLWHSRFDDDPGHQWLRLVIEEIGLTAQSSTLNHYASADIDAMKRDEINPSHI